MNLIKEHVYAAEIYEQITKLFEKDGEDYRYKLTEVDLTAFLIGQIMACNMFYQHVTDDNGDLIDFINLQTRLTFQYLIENGKEDK